MVDSLDQNSDAQLVKAAQQGCVDSLGLLYERYYVAMVAIGYAMLGYREPAEDLAQEVFVIACRDLDKLKRPARVGAWLAGICRNQARLTLRNRGRPTPLPMAFAVESHAGRDLHDLEALQTALARLKPSEREPIALRYYDNLSYERIASVLNCSTRAVNSRLMRAKQKMAKHFKHNGLKGDDHGTA